MQARFNTKAQLQRKEKIHVVKENPFIIRHLGIKRLERVNDRQQDKLIQAEL